MRSYCSQKEDPAQDNTEEWVTKAEASGVHKHGDRLRLLLDATTVRVRDGELLVTDGPFAETKEWIAGYDVLECADLDEAIAIGRSPNARMRRDSLAAWRHRASTP